MFVNCNNEECENYGVQLEKTGSDSRQQWFEEYFECHICNTKKIHRREFNEEGLVISDTLIDVTEEDNENARRAKNGNEETEEPGS